MDVYSPSHPTDQDMDLESESSTPIEIYPEDSKKMNDINVIDSEGNQINKVTIQDLPKTDLNLNSTQINQACNNDCDSSATPCIDEKPIEKQSDDILTETHDSKPTKHKDKKHISEKQTDTKYKKDKSTDKGNSRISTHSKSSRHRSRSPRKGHVEKSPDRRGARKRSTSRSRYHRTGTHRRSRSRSRDRRRRRSRSTSRSRYQSRNKDSRRNRRSRSMSRNRGDRKQSGMQNKSNIEGETKRHFNKSEKKNEISEIGSTRNNQSSLIVECNSTKRSVSDVTPRTPNISQNKSVSNLKINIAPLCQNETLPNITTPFMLRNSAPIPYASGMPWQIQNHPTHINNHVSQIPQPPVASFVQNQFPRVNRFNAGYQQTFAPHRNLPPRMLQPRPFYNVGYHSAQGGYNLPMANHHMMHLNGPINPQIPPANLALGGLLNTPPPILPRPLPGHFAPPPQPPFVDFFKNVSMSQSQNAIVSTEPSLTDELFEDEFEEKELDSRCDIFDEMPYVTQQSMNDKNSNILETLINKAGLSVDSLGGLNLSNPISSNKTENLDKSPVTKINKLLNSAASTLLSHFEAQGVLHSASPLHASPPPPPPPPPPLPIMNVNKISDFEATVKTPFVLPPLPMVSGSCFENKSAATDADKEQAKKHGLGNYDTKAMLLKRRRADFDSFREWQERIALEIKSFLKPCYAAGKISKDDCKIILKKSVTKISRSGCSHINTKKIGEFTKSYLHKFYKYRKWQARQAAKSDSLDIQKQTTKGS